eukprot:106330_1
MALLVTLILFLNHYVHGAEKEEIYNCVPNDDACNEYNCSTLNAIERSGFICHEFPYFTGGWQIVNYDSYWKKEMETISRCNISTDITLPHSACMEWSTSSITHSNMNHTCFCTTNTTKTCETWQCHSTGNINNDIYQFPTAHCDCLHYKDGAGENASCVDWNCVESYDDSNININTVTDIMDHVDKIYNASYRCLTDKPDINSIYYEHFIETNTSSFCWHWIADKINLAFSEWKIASCQCDIPHVAYCYQWSCSEKSMEYYRITPQQFYVGWIVISAAGGIVLMCVCVKLYAPNNESRSVASMFCLCCCLMACTILILGTLLILCFIVSGLAGVVVVCSVWIFSTLVISPLVKWLWIKKRESYWSDDEDDELRYSNNSNWHSKNKNSKNTRTYDFWSGTAKAKYNQVYEYEPYDPI